MSATTDYRKDALDQLDAEITRYRTMTDTLRSRAETSAKALGALGLTVVSAIGFVRVGDLFPLPPGGSLSWHVWDCPLPWSDRWRSSYDDAVLALVAALAGFLLMALVVIVFSTRIWRLQRPVSLVPDRRSQPRFPLGPLPRSWLPGFITAPGFRRQWFFRSDGRGLNPAEYRYLLHTRDALAAERAVSFDVYQLRGAMLLEAANGFEAAGGDADAAALTRYQAAFIGREIEKANALVGLDVVRRRATCAISDRWAWLLGAAFLAGILMFAVGTNYLSGERTDAPAIAKACKDAGAGTHSAYCTKGTSKGTASTDASKPAVSTVNIFPGPISVPAHAVHREPRKWIARRVLDGLRSAYHACTDARRASVRTALGCRDITKLMHRIGTARWRWWFPAKVARSAGAGAGGNAGSGGG
jgi:hypothetical protein